MTEGEKNRRMKNGNRPDGFWLTYEHERMKNKQIKPREV